ncbi:hypothetical protein F5B20DRAFT_592526 [Whalleya microplaca]|nr:hypothetical protein F5B20DRAFT_592526 [Whalleya microplaca]
MFGITLKHAMITMIAMLAFQAVTTRAMDPVSMTTSKDVKTIANSHDEMHGVPNAASPSQSSSFHTSSTSIVVKLETNLEDHAMQLVSAPAETREFSLPTSTPVHKQTSESISNLEPRRYYPVVINGCHGDEDCEHSTARAIAGITIGSIIGFVFLVIILECVIKTYRRRDRLQRGRVNVQREQARSLVLRRILHGRVERSSNTQGEAV